MDLVLPTKVIKINHVFNCLVIKLYWLNNLGMIWRLVLKFFYKLISPRKRMTRGIFKTICDKYT